MWRRNNPLHWQKSGRPTESQVMSVELVSGAAVVSTANFIRAATLSLEMEASFDYWSGVAAFSQTLATIIGVVMNVALFVCLRTVPLGELRVFVPLIIVHSSIDLTHVFLNAIGVLRAVNDQGKIYLILTGPIAGATDPWFSILLSSYFWTVVLESLICVISMVFRFFLVSKGYKPTIFLVGVLTFLSGMIAMMLGLVYFFSYSVYGNSDNEPLALNELTQRHPFWRRKTFDFAVIDSNERPVRIFFVVIACFCAFCYFVSFLFAWRIKRDLRRRHATTSLRTETVKLSRAADRLLSVNIFIPILFYLIPVATLMIYAAAQFNRPTIGYLISIPYCWMPAAKAIGILVVMPAWRRAAKRWLHGENSRAKRGMTQRGQTVHPRVSQMELSHTSRASDSKY